MVPILINKDMFEPTYNDLKFTIWNCSYFCINLNSSCKGPGWLQFQPRPLSSYGGMEATLGWQFQPRHISSYGGMEGYFRLFYIWGRRPVIPVFQKCLSSSEMFDICEKSEIMGITVLGQAGRGVRHQLHIDLLSSVFTFLRPLTMPHQGLLLFRMAPLCVLLSMLMVSCFNFCLCHKNSVSIFTQVEGSLGSKKVSMPPGLLWEFLSFFYLFFYFTILYWFCHTLTWICHESFL